MQNHAVVFQSWKTKDKADHPVSVKGANQHTTNLPHRHHCEGRKYFAVINAPDLFLEFFDGAHLRDFFYAANAERFKVGSGHVRAWIAWSTANLCQSKSPRDTTTSVRQSVRSASPCRLVW